MNSLKLLQPRRGNLKAPSGTMSHGRVGQSGTSEDDPRNILDPGNHVIERRDSLAVYEDFLCTSTTTILPAELDRSGRVGSQFKEGAPPQTQTKWVLRFDGNSIRVGGNHAIWPPNAPLKLAFYSTGLDGNTAGTFKPVNQKDFPHGAATELNIITSFICTRLQSPCNASQDAVNRCQQVQNSLSGQTGGQAADNWNGQFGINSNYGGQNGGNNGNGQSTTTTTTTTTRAPTTTTTTTPAENRDPNPTTTTTTTTPGSSASGESQGLSSSSSSSATTTTTAAGSDVTDVDGMIKDEHCTLQAILVTVTLPAGSQATGTSSPNVLVPVTGFNALDLGTCTDPTVALGQGLGGRQPNEWAFMNNNIAQFPHGSALDLLTILQFTCNNLVNRCGLSTTSNAVSACNNAQAEAMKYGNTGVGADIFNRGMGFSTYYAAVDGS